MERGVYFDGWYKHNHCYHPSLPIRSRQMLEDLEKDHATVLAWAGLGGGSISLPYLMHEAFGPVDPRMQIYGYMNDSEFIAECTRRGIRLFGIVFEVKVFTPRGVQPPECSFEGCDLVLRDAGVYTIIELT